MRLNGNPKGDPADQLHDFLPPQAPQELTDLQDEEVVCDSQPEENLGALSRVPVCLTAPAGYDEASEGSFQVRPRQLADCDRKQDARRRGQLNRGSGGKMRNTRNCPGDDSPPGDSAWQPSLRRRQRISSSEDEDKENSAVGLTSSRRPEPLPGMSKALAHSRVPRRRLQKRVQSPGDDTLVQLDETSAPAGPSHSLPHSSGNVSGLKTSASAIVVIHSTSSESSDAAGSPFLGIGGRRPRAAALGGVLNDSDSSLDDPLGISRARACSRSAAKQPALMDRASNLPRGASTAQLAHGAGGRSPDHLASDGMPPSQRRGNNETPIDSDSDLDDPLGISVARASLSAARRQLISPMSRMSSDARQDGCVFLPRNSLAPLVEPAGPPSSSKPYSWRHGTMPQIQGDFECGGAGHPENPKKGTVRVAGCEAGGKTATTAASQNVLSSKCLDGSAALSPSLGAPSALPRQQGSHTRPCVALDSPEPNDLQGGAERISEMPGHGTPDQADSIVSTAMTPSKWSGLRLTSAPPRATCRNPVHSEGRPVLAPVEGSSQQISGPEAVFRAQPSAAHRAATVRNLAVTNLAWGDAGSPWCAPTSTNVDSRAIQWLQAGAAQRDEDDWIEETSDGDLQQESKRMDRPYLGPGTSVAWGGSARQGPPGVLDKDLVNAITEPWWSRLEDFVPVLSIKAGYDPRNGANVHINYMEQFTGTASPTTEQRGGCKRKRRTGPQASVGLQKAGQYITEGGQRIYVTALGDRLHGSAGYRRAQQDAAPAKKGTKNSRRKTKFKGGWRRKH